MSRIGVGSTVGLVISDPIDFSVAFLATIATGRWAAPLDPSTPVHGAGGMTAAIARVEADIVFADRSLPAGLDVDWVDLGAVSLHGAVTPGPAVIEPRRAEAGGAVLASSGTTGVPKVVPLPQQPTSAHRAQRVGASRPLPEGPGVQLPAVVPYQCRSRGSFVRPGRRIVARARRSFSPHRTSGS